MREKTILLLIIAIFVVHALSLNFTQDDAFISYRYVKNFINGHGLVFNPGERVEGYTNFLWIIILSIFAQLGLDMIIVSKILGVAAGATTLFLVYQISLDLFRRKDWFFPLFAPLLLASNSAFAYWSISGLETAFFVMAVLLSAYFYFINGRLMIISSVLTSLIRPEGVLIFAVLILHKFFFKKDGIKSCLSYILGFALLLLPFLIFKIFYYGDLLPNPFYAKTGFSLEYLQSGFEYFWLFLKHYGLWGVLYVLPILFYKSLDKKQRLFVLFTYFFTFYVIVIGGDVLMVHRFFLPVLPFLYLVFALLIGKLFLIFKKRSVAILISVLLTFLLLAGTLLLPLKWITGVRERERAFVEKMKFWAEALNSFYGTNITVAASTIGALSYYLDAKVIDMLGLTDKYISRHPEIIPGMVSSWKERRFNTRYLLSLDPDFILFSTGSKPSAPAERALFLNSKFRENYYPVSFPYQETFHEIFKRKGNYLKENSFFKDIEFVNLYSEAFNLEGIGNHRGAIEKLKRAAQIGPTDFAWVCELMGQQYFFLKDYSQSKEYLQKAIERDDHCIRAHFYLLQIYRQKGMLAEVQREEEKLLEYNPELFGHKDGQKKNVNE